MDSVNKPDGICLLLPPHLQKLVPKDYDHTVCSFETAGEDHFKAAIKLKLSSEKEAKKWLEDFQVSSGITWRTSKTYPNSGRYNKYRVSYALSAARSNLGFSLFQVARYHLPSLITSWIK